MNLVSVGIRASTSEINYVIIEGSFANPKLITADKLREPISYSFSETLVYYRVQFLSLCKEYKINTCGIRTAEPLSRLKGSSEGAIKRANIEGVMIEASASQGIKTIVGANSTFSPLLDVKSIKDLISAKEYKNLSKWTKLSQDFKEATLVAIASQRLLEA